MSGTKARWVPLPLTTFALLGSVSRLHCLHRGSQVSGLSIILLPSRLRKKSVSSESPALSG